MARPRSDVKQRFLSKVKIVNNGCHEWQSTIKKDGYGSFYFDGKQVQAHRVAFQIFIGIIPDGKWVLHKCDNRKCVNTDHLFLGDCQMNISDMDNKGRRGTVSQLTLAQVEEIKRLLSEGEIIPARWKAKYSQRKIAEMYGIDQTTISRIKLGKTTLFKI